ncbi:MarR family winged helix-turn-helix transcriptional regulator [Mangrovicoccus ximenensis]|uniref:MarR family winged helix-turn-helix transcriptional regulator n=1 Tax=Mangrovicoccus ximenensis TaxID=1911570 RepID=UPI000D3598DB|nr:MarR family winged helix-turn-helix transcriptional regulator [Mangrovicoccus ximenensis]
MGRTWSKAFHQGNAIYQLNMLASIAVDSADARFVDLVGLDIRTIRVLRLIGDNPGVTFGEITGMTALERSLASRLIQNLVRGRLVERRNLPEDARKFGLYITPEGQEARDRADRLSEIGMEVLFEALAPEELAAFTAAMAKLADWIDSDAYEEKSAAAYAAVQFGAGGSGS